MYEPTKPLEAWVGKALAGKVEAVRAPTPQLVCPALQTDGLGQEAGYTYTQKRDLTF